MIRLVRISRLGLLALLSLIFMRCENDEKDLPSFRKKQVVVDEAKQVLIYYSTNAKVTAKLTSPFMLNSQSDPKYIEFPRSLHVDFYNDKMIVESQTDALYGKYFEPTQ